MQRQIGILEGPSSTTLMRGAGLLQRKCRCAQHASHGHACESCRKRRGAIVQRRGGLASNIPAVPPLVHDVLRSPGRPLDPATRTFMESRFGRDFSRVRVHTDARAADSARAVGALAYTVGRDIAFDAGRYAPGTASGRRLLAHELAHVVQQAGATGGLPTAVGPASGPYESEAERAALAVVGADAGRVGASPPRLTPLAGSAPLQRLGANPGCSSAEAGAIHQAIYNARGWLNKAIKKFESNPLPAAALSSLRRNFGPIYGVAVNRVLILNRLRAALHEISTIPIGCAGPNPADPADPCLNGHCGFTPIAGGHGAMLCSNVTLAPGVQWQFQAGCVLHETFHSAFSRMGATSDHYSGWHGFSGSSSPYPGPGLDPLLNADSYTTLVFDLS